MKRFLSVLLLTALLISTVSCDSTEKPSENSSDSLPTSEEASTTENNTETIGDETSSAEVSSTEEETEETSDEEASSEETSSEDASSDETTVSSAETSSETETENEEIKMTYEEYEVKASSDVDALLADAKVLKLGYNYALVNSQRVYLFDEYTSPRIIDGRLMIYLDFVKTYLSVNFSDGDVVRNEYNDEFLPLDVIARTYTEYFYDEETGVIAIYGKYAPKLDPAYVGSFNRDVVNKLALGYTVSAQMTGTRPVVILSDEQLDLAISKAKAGFDPWYTEWESLENTAKRLVGTVPAPDKGASATAYRLAACKDLINARYLALAYLYTEDEKYLNTALVYLKAYAEPMLGTDKYLDYSSKGGDGQPDIGMNIALPLVTACDTYAILYEHISDADKQIIEAWVRAEANICVKGHKFWLKEDYFGNQVGNNHLTSHLMGIMAAAYVLEDDKLLDYALCSDDNPANFKEMITRAILMEGDSVYKVDPDADFAVGEIYDRYRVVQSTGFGYALYHLKFLTYSSMILRNNGIDTFIYVGENGENIALPFAAYADYLIYNDDSLGNGHYVGNSLQRESSLSLYLIAYSVYGDDKIADVIEALEASGVKSYENELFGSSTPFLFAYFNLF